MWTFDELWKEYQSQREKTLSLKTDDYRYRLYIHPTLGSKEPGKIVPLDVERLRINLMKKRSPQTVKHVISLVKRIASFGQNKGLCAGLAFRPQMPGVDNKATGAGALWIAESKGGKAMSIPLNDAAADILDGLPRTSAFVFPGEGGGQRVSVQKASKLLGFMKTGKNSPVKETQDTIFSYQFAMVFKKVELGYEQNICYAISITC